MAHFCNAKHLRMDDPLRAETCSAIYDIICVGV